MQRLPFFSFHYFTNLNPVQSLNLIIFLGRKKVRVGISINQKMVGSFLLKYVPGIGVWNSWREGILWTLGNTDHLSQTTHFLKWLHLCCLNVTKGTWPEMTSVRTDASRQKHSWLWLCIHMQNRVPWVSKASTATSKASRILIRELGFCIRNKACLVEAYLQLGMCGLKLR